VNAALALPKDDTAYSISIRVSDKEIETEKAVHYKGSYNRYNFRTDLETATFEGPYLNIEDVGSVFIYLKKKFKIGGVKNICYWRGHAREFTNVEPIDLKWVQLLPDKAINEVKTPHKAGLVGLKISIRDVSHFGAIDWT